MGAGGFQGLSAGPGLPLNPCGGGPLAGGRTKAQPQAHATEIFQRWNQIPSIPTVCICFQLRRLSWSLPGPGVTQTLLPLVLTLDRPCSNSELPGLDLSRGGHRLTPNPPAGLAHPTDFSLEKLGRPRAGIPGPVSMPGASGTSGDFGGPSTTAPTLWEVPTRVSSRTPWQGALRAPAATGQSCGPPFCRRECEAWRGSWSRPPCSPLCPPVSMLATGRGSGRQGPWQGASLSQTASLVF